VVYKAARQYGRLRELARVYGLLTRDVARTKNRIKSLFRRRGVPCPGDAIYHAEVREKRLAALPPAMRRSVELLGFELECLEELKAEAEEAMLEEAGGAPLSRLGGGRGIGEADHSRGTAHGMSAGFAHR
jgi:hypothetical protein